MRYKMYLCPNCKYKTSSPPEKIKSGRYICPRCQAGMKIVRAPGYEVNQTREMNPLERWRRQEKHSKDEKELEEA